MKLYWYCLSYLGKSSRPQDVDQHGFPETCNASVYKGLEDAFVTAHTILHSKEDAGVRADAVLISCSYLGHMTKEEFESVK